MMLPALLRRWTYLALLATLAAALVGMLVLAPGAFADAFTPESRGSQNAVDIDTLYKITLYIGIVIFVGVEGTLLYSLIKYRARRGGPEAEQIHGNTPLEIGWTIGAALILVVLTVVTFLYLPDIENPPASGPNGLRAEQASFASIDQPDPPTSGGPYLTIRVNGQQYLWRYDYAGGDQLFSYYEMVVPTDTTVVLEVTASDVIHSWWIPDLGGKVDGVPGLRERDLVQDPRRQGGRLRRPVRGAVRLRARRHARAGEGGHARRVRGLGAADAPGHRRRRASYSPSNASAARGLRGSSGSR